jgi:hypothetical protein
VSSSFLISFYISSLARALAPPLESRRPAAPPPGATPTPLPLAPPELLLLPKQRNTTDADGCTSMAETAGEEEAEAPAATCRVVSLEAIRRGRREEGTVH